MLDFSSMLIVLYVHGVSKFAVNSVTLNLQYALPTPALGIILNLLLSRIKHVIIFVEIKDHA